MLYKLNKYIIEQITIAEYLHANKRIDKLNKKLKDYYSRRKYLVKIIGNIHQQSDEEVERP